MLYALIDFFIITLFAVTLCNGSAALEAVCPHGDDGEPSCDPRLRHAMETVTMMELDAPTKEDIKLQLLQTHRAKRHAPNPEQDHEKTAKLAGVVEQPSMSAEHVKDEFSHFSTKEDHGIGLQLSSSVAEEDFGPQAGLDSWGDVETEDQKERAALSHTMHLTTHQLMEPMPANAYGNVSLSMASGMMAELQTRGEGSNTLDVLRQLMVVIIGVFLALSRFCWFPSPLGRCRKRSASPPVPAAVRSPACVYAEKFRIASVSDVEHRIAELRESDDSNPTGSGRAMRIQVRVEGLTDGSMLLTPLTQRACTIYSAAATCEKGPGLVAFASKAPKFVVSVVGAPMLKIEVKGEDVSLFDMSAGKWSHHEPLISAPEQMQDFVLTHMDMAPECECQTICALREAPSMDFHETALLVGTVATMVGELRRTPEGRLPSLHPLLDATCDDLRLEPWRSPTSFCPDKDELSTCGSAAASESTSEEVITPTPSQQSHVLLVSDNPELLSTLPRIGAPAKGADVKSPSKASDAKSPKAASLK